MDKLTHIDEKGKPEMVDISNKKIQHRFAKASGRIILKKSTISLIAENQIKKGNVLTIAEIAGIQAAKRTAELIPLCHPLQITKISVKAAIDDQGDNDDDSGSVSVISQVSCIGQTGVEMESLTAVSVALLTIYDMCKAVDKDMRIEDIVLLKKSKMDI